MKEKHAAPDASRIVKFVERFVPVTKEITNHNFFVQAAGRDRGGWSVMRRRFSWRW